MNAAVGPVTCSREPPSAATTQPGHDRRVEAVLRRDADGDRQRHRQRQRDDADDDARQHVGAQIGPRVALAQHRAQGGGGQILGLDGTEPA